MTKLLYTYRTVFSDRRSLALEIEKDGSLLVRAPYGISAGDIRSFVASHSGWIDAHLPRVLERAQRDAEHEASDDEIRTLVSRAMEYLPGRVRYFAGIMGITPAGITVTGAKTRWGSCSPKNRLCFSWRLMQFPKDAIDYVVVHELAHIRHHDHSRAFYAEIEKILPDYRAREEMLRSRQYASDE